MSTKAPAIVKILVVADIVDDATLVRSMLSREFDHVATSNDPRQAVADFDKYQPDVLILAFNELSKSEQYYLGLFRLSKTVNQHPHRTVILCNQDEVTRVAELCMKNFFDDYILFWPMTYDSPRLLMSVHNAIRELELEKNHEPPTEPYTDQIRKLAEVNSANKKNESRNEIHSLAEAKPDQRPQQEVHELTMEANPSGTLGNRDGHKLITVLVVDDDTFQRNLIKQLLKSENYHVLFAASGIDALNILQRAQPDVILMDVIMPDMDGIETTRRLKAMPQHAKTPVIMVTGDSEGTVVVDSLKAGASNFVVKPFNSATLIDKINHALAATKK
jgi:CheY-like chemotaxis protein